MAYAARLGRTLGFRVHQPRGQRAMQARYILRAHRRGDPGRRLSVRHLFEPVGPTDRRAAGRVRPAHPRKPSHDAVDLPPDGGARKRKLRPEKRAFEDAKREAARKGMEKILETDKNIWFINPGMELETTTGDRRRRTPHGPQVRTDAESSATNYSNIAETRNKIISMFDFSV